MPSNAVTKQDLEKTKQGLERVLERQTTVLTESIRGINTNFNESQAKQTKHFDEQISEVRVELDAIKDMLALRKDVEKLERSLLRKGVLTQQDLAAAE